MKKAFILVSLLLVVIMLFTSCSKTTTTTTTTAAATTPAVTTTTAAAPTATTTAAAPVKKGGTLRWVYPYSPTSVPGWPSDDSNFQRLWMLWTVFEPLVKPDAKYQPIPWLAQSWDWGPERKYITFNLRSGVKFHDGSAFTAEAVKLEGDIMINRGKAIGLTWDRWEIIDDLHIRLYLKKYQTDFWNGFYSVSMSFASPTAYKANGGDNGGDVYMKAHPIGTGPFTFDYFEKDVTVKLKANKNYWQAGKPYLDGLTFITVKESLTAQSAMQAGEGDVWSNQRGKVLFDMKNAGFTVLTDYGGTNFIMFDTMNEGSVTNDPKVRMAIEYAIDKQKIADAIGYGFLKVTNQLPPPTNPSFNPNLPSRNYDPAKAKALLKEAGYPDGVALSLITVGATAETLSVQQYLQDVGFKVTLESIDNAKFWDYSGKGWKGAMITGYAVGANWPSTFKGYFGPASVVDVSVKIPTDILAKVDAALVIQDEKEAKAASDQILKDLYEMCWLVPLYANAVGFAVRTDIKDSGIETFSDWSVWSPENCWINR
jgi:peptide/nickel transport system substrate-binding protein